MMTTSIAFAFSTISQYMSSLNLLGLFLAGMDVAGKLFAGG